MVKVVVVTLFASTVELSTANGYVPFRASCPRAPLTVTRFEFRPEHAGMAGLGQSPGLTIPWGERMTSVAVFPVFVMDCSLAVKESAWVLAYVLQKEFGAPKACPMSK